MTLAIVKVLPEPVTPRSAAWRRPAGEPVGHLGDGPRLVALRRVLGDEAERRHVDYRLPRGAAGGSGAGGQGRRDCEEVLPPRVQEGGRVRVAEQVHREQELRVDGVRSSAIPDSSGVRLPLCRLQRRQAATTFVQVVSPPRDRGSTWSTVRRSPRRLQYWQV